MASRWTSWLCISVLTDAIIRSVGTCQIVLELSNWEWCRSHLRGFSFYGWPPRTWWLAHQPTVHNHSSKPAWLVHQITGTQWLGRLFLGQRNAISKQISLFARLSPNVRRQFSMTCSDATQFLDNGRMQPPQHVIHHSAMGRSSLCSQRQRPWSFSCSQSSFIPCKKRWAHQAAFKVPTSTWTLKLDHQHKAIVLQRCLRGWDLRHRLAQRCATPRHLCTVRTTVGSAGSLTSHRLCMGMCWRGLP